MEILSFFLKFILIFQQETHNPVKVVKRAKKIYLKNYQNIDVFFLENYDNPEYNLIQ